MIVSVGRMWRKGSPCALLVEMEVSTAIAENSREVPLKTESSHHTISSPTPEYCQKEVRSLSCRDPRLVEVPTPCSLQNYSTAKIRKQLKCPLVDEQIRENAVLTYAVGYHSAIE